MEVARNGLIMINSLKIDDLGYPYFRDPYGDGSKPYEITM
jgi:hypothetical protein